MKHQITFFVFVVIALSACNNSDKLRDTQSLNGIWQVAESIDTLSPTQFNNTVPVPGLLDLAKTSYDSVGYVSTKRKYFWYKRSFNLSTSNKDFAILKIHKAKFGHTVFINGQYVGKYNFCFTPSFFKINQFLKEGENEILIRTGASPDVLPDSIPFGYDVEKTIFYPGIYDNVEFIRGNYPYIENVQIVPDIKNEKISAVTYLENDDQPVEILLAYTVRGKKHRDIVKDGEKQISLTANESAEITLEIEIPKAELWSPENPYLYELEVRTSGDSKRITFGMREFRFDPKTKMVMLNGKPYYLRGTNVALHRFFEDPLRKGLPWDREWIEKMHDEFKDMNWNSHRFHIGFAPEVWYEIADEKGVLVQDEYAVWGCWSDAEKKRHQANVLAQEYENWMKERWNHPSVVIWDAQNETKWQETGKAIQTVRHLDLSNRPWDNGYSAPQSSEDLIESHPYLFTTEKKNTFAIQPPWRYDSSKAKEKLPEGGWLKNELSVSPETFNDANEYFPPAENTKFPNPIIVNEYGWIWLYRNGDPAWAAEAVWKLYPELDTPEKRWEWRGRVIAAQTEYWRSRRDLSGIQHFCSLTCDRYWGEKRSQVSDEWMDVNNLIMQPGFKKYVKPAFSPVGIMIRKWDNTFNVNEKISVPVILYNDLYEDWKGEVSLKIMKNKEMIYGDSKSLTVSQLGKSELLFGLTLPEIRSKYEMVAEIDFNGERVFSSRLFEIRE
jgi:hypothetical protein